MTTQIEIAVVYENGVFKPLNPLQIALAEGKELKITRQFASETTNVVSEQEEEGELTPERIKEIIKSIKTYKSVKEFKQSPESKLPPRAGTVKTPVWMAEDFNARLEDFEEYM